MNKLILAARCGILTLAFLITGVFDAQAQGQCENIDRVRVNMWPLPAVEGTTIRSDFGKITSEVLTAIQKIEYNAAVTPSLTPELRQSVHNIAENYCVLKGIDRAYKVLVVPLYDAPMRYEIRGLHLVTRSGASTDLPQVILTFSIQGDQVKLEDIRVEFNQIAIHSANLLMAEKGKYMN